MTRWLRGVVRFVRLLRRPPGPRRPQQDLTHEQKVVVEKRGTFGL